MRTNGQEKIQSLARDRIVEPLLHGSHYEKRLKIIRAIDRPLGKLSVQDICDKVGISRQTFYSYFDSKYDIPLWLMSVCYSRSVYLIGSLLTYRDGIRTMYHELEGEAEFFSFVHQDLFTRACQDRICIACKNVILNELRARDIAIDESLEWEAYWSARTIYEGTVRYLYTPPKMGHDDDYYAMMVSNLIPHRIYDLTNTPRNVAPGAAR